MIGALPATPGTNAPLPYPFDLDPFQKQAIDVVERGQSLLLAAPTGAGKTVVAEAAIARALRTGHSVIYTAPVKALSNQKHHDFGQLFGSQNVGIMTGDVTENDGAPLLVMTTEILHNMLVCRDLSRIERVSCLVFDEFHYLADRDRGRVWEETIILCPKDIQLVCLSATMTNIDELAGWIGDVFGEVEVVVNATRPVPLRYHYFTLGELRPALRPDGRPNRKLLELERYDSQREVSAANPRWDRSRRGPVTSPVDVVDALLAADMVPALYFVFSRKETERLAVEAAGNLPAPPLPVQEEIRQCLAERVARLGPELRDLSQTARLRGCLEAGVAFHHAGVLPDLKELVEDLFARGLIRVLFATETFALGVNMPARTVVLARITKWDGEAHRQITAREFQQMAGRAGRRGKDVLGHVVIVSDPFMSFDGVAQLLMSQAEPVDSAFALTYNSYLNLVESYGPDAAEEIVKRSFLLHQLVDQGGRLAKRLQSVRSQIGGLTAKFPAASPNCYVGHRGNPLLHYEATTLDRSRAEHERRELDMKSRKLLRQGYDRSAQARLKSAHGRGAYLEQEAARLDLEMAQSPCHGCIRLEEHRREAQRLSTLSKEQDQLERRAAHLEHQLQSRQGQELTVIRHTLEALGYAGPGRQQDKSRLLAGIFDGAALQLAELVDKGELDRLSAAELAEVVSWFASADRQRPTYDRRPRRELLGRLRTMRLIVEDLGEEIRDIEQQFGDVETEVVRPLYPNLIRQWCDGITFGALSDQYEADEGDVASHIAKTGNLLRQLEKATTELPAYAAMHRKAAEARDLLTR